MYGLLVPLVALPGGCSRDVDPFGDNFSGGGTQTGAPELTTTAGAGETMGATRGGSGAADNGTTGSVEVPTGSGTAAALFDVGVATSETGVEDAVCMVIDGMDPTPCVDQSPPDSFDPAVQWSWGEPGVSSSVVIPLVANFTDDDDNGVIDLCDVPDVVLTTLQNRLVLLDGATGAEHWIAATAVHSYTTPAVGDIDDDGLVEIVTRSASNQLKAFNNDGTTLWTASLGPSVPLVGAVALADLDADGDVEILYGGGVYDHLGALLWSAPQSNSWSATIAVDLDDDGDMEVVVGPIAYHHDGSVYFTNPGITTAYTGTYAQIADLDDDPEPEILIAAEDGVAVLEHDGTIKFSAWGGGSGDANRPLAIHDFDGDNSPEFGASALQGEFAFGVYEPSPAAVLWSGGAIDSTGQSGGTAFDFLGAGVAQAIYADETELYVYDDLGGVLMSAPRSSLTHIEYPVIVDVDNDGSAEILMVSSEGPNLAPQTAPALQVIRDVQERWVPARRIWNQHSYHVTNVYEDGTIPQVEAKSWQQLNTYRTQAQVTSSGVCQPVPAG